MTAADQGSGGGVVSPCDEKQLEEIRAVARESTDLALLEEVSPLVDWKDRLAVSERSSLGFAAPGGSFTQAIFEAAYHKHLPLQGRLSGQVVVELGAGMTGAGYMLAALMGARAYVGIEPFYADVLFHVLSSFEESAMPERLVVGYDMLDALIRFPDQSVSFFAFGIERCVLPEGKYMHCVEHEMKRVLTGELYMYKSDLFSKIVPDEQHPFQRFDTARQGELRIYSGQTFGSARLKV
jgi:hypothetical protein